MELTVGQIVEGKITGITNFGVFVDLGNSVTGMVHISEVAATFVSEIRDHVSVNDVVKMKVLTIGEDGKISLSIKRAAEKPQRDTASARPASRQRERHASGPDSSYVWTATKSESQSFEDMMNRFKQSSEEKFSDLKRKNPDARRVKRGAGGR